MKYDVLVTGAAGFIGSSLVDLLLSKGKKVLGIDNLGDLLLRRDKIGNLQSAIKNKNFKFVLDNFENVYRYEDTFSKVVHLAAYAGVRPSFEKSDSYIVNNIRSMNTFLLACAAHNVEHFIFASSSSVYGDSPTPFKEVGVTAPISIYGATKHAGEGLCRSYYLSQSMPCTCLRFFTCYGPRQRPDLAIHKFLKLIKDRRPIEIYGHGETSRDYTYIDDIVNGIFLSLELENPKFQIINLGNRSPVQLNTLLQVMFSSLNMNINDYNIRRIQSVTGDVITTCADISLANSYLGWYPTIDIEVGIEKFIKWFDSNNY